MKRAAPNPTAPGNWAGGTAVVSSATLLGVVLALAFVTTARAHDPYEITSQVLVHSNRIEVRLTMEFPAAMLLAGGEARAESPGDEFARVLPELRRRAGDFLRLTAGDRPWPATATNVALGVENHVNVELEYPVTEASNLRFEVGALSALSKHGPYGTSLTVLDMVYPRVLAQAVLFGDSAPLELPASPTRPGASAPASNPQTSAAPAEPSQSAARREVFPGYTRLVVFCGFVALLGLLGWWTRRRSGGN